MRPLSPDLESHLREMAAIVAISPRFGCKYGHIVVSFPRWSDGFMSAASGAGASRSRIALRCIQGMGSANGCKKQKD